MPMIQIACGALTDEQRRGIARGISRVLVENGQPESGIVILFRQVDKKEVAIGSGVFPYWPEEESAE